VTEFKKALEKYAKYVIQQSRSNLTKGRTNASKQLYNSLSYKIDKNKVTFESEKYGEFIDKGVRGANHDYAESQASPFRFRSKQPPSSVFDKWIKERGIKGRDKKTGRFITNKSLSFLIARSIKNKGIRATMFFTKPFEAGIDKYSDEMIEALLNDNIEL
tara:strand:+ start:183 stop:662 length:480 start_codon:yes stop_codon:yes gene_type:complete